MPETMPPSSTTAARRNAWNVPGMVVRPPTTCWPTRTRPNWNRHSIARSRWNQLDPPGSGIIRAPTAPTAGSANQGTAYRIALRSITQSPSMRITSSAGAVRTR